MEKGRIKVTYRISTECSNASARALDICLEQTVEVTEDIIKDQWIGDHIVGKIEEIREVGENTFQVIISYAEEITGYNLSGLLNLIYGNISLKRGLWVEKLDLPLSFVSHFRGPRSGIKGIRERLGIHHRPLLAAPLKPMGKSPEALAKLCYELALGGIDIIKDDHGLADQSFCPFRERVRLCMKAIRKAQKETGRTILYFPSLTGEYEKMNDLFQWASEEGVGGILAAPFITGLDFMRYIAENDRIGLSVMSHPALTGTFFNDPCHGMGHQVLLGTLMRLAGADMVIYPNFIGRFPFTREICQSINNALSEPFYHLEASFPVPAGGISLSKIPQLKETFGRETVFLVGSSLFSRSDDIVDNARYFLSLVESEEKKPPLQER